MLPLTVIFLTVFIDLVGFGMIIPLTPYLGKTFGADAFVVGLLMASYSAFQFLFSPFWGRLSDRIGRRPILLMSLAGSAASHLLFGLAGSIVTLFIARGLAGIFAANISTAMAYIADVTDEKNRSRGMGMIGAAFGLGFVVGPALGGILAIYHPNTVAFVASGICFLNFLVATKVLKESLKPGTVRPRASRWGTFKENFNRPVIPTLMSVSFLNSIGLAAVEAVLFFVVADRFGWDLGKASFGFAYVGIAMALTQGLIVRRILPKWGERVVLIIGTILFALAMFTTAFAPSVWTMAIAMTLLALGTGFVNPSVNGSVSLLSDKNKQGEVLGMVQSLSALSRVLGPPLGGYLYANWGGQSPFLFSGVSGSVAFVLVLLAFRRLPVVAKNASNKKAETFPANAVGIFQLRNITASEVPYLMLDVRVKSEPIGKHAGLFKKLEYVPAEKVLTELALRKIDLQYPIIIIDEDGEISSPLAKSMETSGYQNVYYLFGGLKALNEEN
jgi:MFS transporter, DHA1 family, tetracycline resistance protein